MPQKLWYEHHHQYGRQEENEPGKVFKESQQIQHRLNLILICHYSQMQSERQLQPQELVRIKSCSIGYVLHGRGGHTAAEAVV